MLARWMLASGLNSIPLQPRRLLLKVSIELLPIACIVLFPYTPPRYLFHDAQARSLTSS